MISSTALIFLALFSHALLTTATSVSTCRFVCPDTVGGAPLLNEDLSPDGSVPECFWAGNGLGARFAGFDSVRPLFILSFPWHLRLTFWSYRMETSSQGASLVTMNSQHGLSSCVWRLRKGGHGLMDKSASPTLLPLVSLSRILSSTSTITRLIVPEPATNLDSPSQALSLVRNVIVVPASQGE